MAEQPCLPQVQACIIRVSDLDANGVPTPGSDTLYVSDGMQQLDVTHVYTDGDELEEKNGCGAVYVNYKAPDTFKRGDVTITLLTPDPYLAAKLSGGDVLTDGSRIGYAAPPLGVITGNGVSIEVWAKRIDDGDLDADSPYAWWVYPKVKNLRLGDHSQGNSVLKPVFTGQLLQNDNWFDGPLNDWPATSDRIWQWLPTATIPTAVCGPQTLAAS